MRHLLEGRPAGFLSMDLRVLSSFSLHITLQRTPAPSPSPSPSQPEPAPIGRGGYKNPKQEPELAKMGSKMGSKMSSKSHLILHQNHQNHWISGCSLQRSSGLLVDP